jgi:hypothetical protein
MTFIRNDQIQTGLISYLKSKTTITSLLDSSAEIKENEWQGDDFYYPAVRVRLISNIPFQSCYHQFECGIQVFSEEASSIEADQISGIIATQFHPVGFTSNSLAFLVHVTNVIPAIRSDIRTWRSEVLIRGLVAS